MFKKYLSRFSHLSLIAMLALMAATAPLSSMAQDDMPDDDDEEIILPSSSSGQETAPTILEPNSGVPVEDYDS